MGCIFPYAQKPKGQAEKLWALARGKGYYYLVVLSPMTSVSHINFLSFNFFIGIIIVSLSEYSTEGMRLILEVGNTVDNRYIAASLTVTRMMVSILSTWVQQLFI